MRALLISLTLLCYQSAFATGLKLNIAISTHSIEDIAIHWVNEFLEEHNYSEISIEQRENYSKINAFNLQNTFNVHIYTLDKIPANTKIDYLIDASNKQNQNTKKIISSFVHKNIIAYAPLKVFVHPDNPITELTVKELMLINSGAISNWSTFSGQDIPINIQYSQIPLFYEMANNLIIDTLNNDEVKTPSSGDMQIQDLKFVHDNEISSGKLLKIADGYTLPILPNSLTTTTQEYPLAKAITAYYTPTTITNALNVYLTQKYSFTSSIDNFLISPQITLHSHNTEKLGPPKYLEVTENSLRLSITINFLTGSSELDAQAFKNIKIFKQYLDANPNAEVTLVGFGDLELSPHRSKILAKYRALAVKAELMKSSIKTKRIVGLGSYLPVAKNTPDKKYKNQRVEIWLAAPSNQISQR